jgi:hypothetical protein
MAFEKWASILLLFDLKSPMKVSVQSNMEKKSLRAIQLICDTFLRFYDTTPTWHLTF